MGNELTIDMTNAQKTKTHVKYANFHIASAATKYTLHVSGFTGTLLDALKEDNRRPFSTFDADNNSNIHGHNCPLLNCGGWWFLKSHCFKAQLNGLYYSGSRMGIDILNQNVPNSYSGIHWLSDGF